MLQPSVLTIPGYRINEYLLVLSPHEALRNKVKEIKADFANSFDAVGQTAGKPYINLVNFSQYDMMEERIVHRLDVVAMGYYPFKVELKDFGSFPSHTIYINVTSREPIKELTRALRPFQQLLKLNNDNKPYFVEEPHLTIARKLLPWQYEKGWLAYRQKSFTSRFIADAMLLLRRPVGEKAYQVLRRLEFRNLPVNTTQGELFS